MTKQTGLISIVVPAYNEGAVIARSLSHMLSGAKPGELEIIVVCNGCVDGTADIARSFGSPVRVIESAIASKTHALNLGDQSARSFPRIYVDADVVLTTAAIRSLARRLECGDIFASAPSPRIDVSGCSWIVRQYFRVRSNLPSAREGIGGSGVYALSQEGRNRFEDFPAIIADDAFVRFHFTEKERKTLGDVASTVFAPRSLTQLISIRSRIYYGMRELRVRFPQLARAGSGSNRRALLRLARSSRFWAGLGIYGFVCLSARLRAWRRARARPIEWDRDESSRICAPSLLTPKSPAGLSPS